MDYFIWILVIQVLIAGSLSTLTGTLFTSHAGNSMAQIVETTNDEDDILQWSPLQILIARPQLQKRGIKRGAQGKSRKGYQQLSSTQRDLTQDLPGQNTGSSRNNGDKLQDGSSSSSLARERSTSSEPQTSATSRQAILATQSRVTAAVPPSESRQLQRTQSLGELAKLKAIPHPTLRRTKSIALMKDTASIKAEMAGKKADAAEQIAKFTRNAMSAKRIEAQRSLAEIERRYHQWPSGEQVAHEKIRRHKKANTDAHAFSDAADASQEANRATRVYRNKKKVESAKLEGETWKSFAKWHSYNAQLHQAQIRDHHERQRILTKFQGQMPNDVWHNALIDHDSSSRRDVTVLKQKIGSSKQLAKHNSLRLQQHVEDNDGYDSEIGQQPAASKRFSPITVGNMPVMPSTPSPSSSS